MVSIYGEEIVTDILIIIAVVTFVVLFFLPKRTKDVPLKDQISDPLEKLVAKPEIIEDSSHLKQQLAETQRNFTEALQEIGKIKRDNHLEQSKNIQLANELIKLQAKFEQLQHQNKSSQVRTGAIGESLLPLHEDFPCNPKTLRLLGSPIDYISFCYDTDMITFIEVKTGESQLNDNQRRVKKMVEEGKVQFKVVRLNEKGMKVK